jgi:hypothetical protein
MLATALSYLAMSILWGLLQKWLLGGGWRDALYHGTLGLARVFLRGVIYGEEYV